MQCKTIRSLWQNGTIKINEKEDLEKCDVQPAGSCVLRVITSYFSQLGCTEKTDVSPLGYSIKIGHGAGQWMHDYFKQDELQHHSDASISDFFETIEVMRLRTWFSAAQIVIPQP